MFLSSSLKGFRVYEPGKIKPFHFIYKTIVCIIRFALYRICLYVWILVCIVSEDYSQFQIAVLFVLLLHPPALVHS